MVRAGYVTGAAIAMLAVKCVASAAARHDAIVEGDPLRDACLDAINAR